MLSRLPLMVAAVAVAATSGCSRSYIVVNDPRRELPPLVAPEKSRPPLRPPPSSYKFHVAVLDFTDQTNAAGDLVRTVPDILTTKLFDPSAKVAKQRYDIYDRGQLRSKGPREVEQDIRQLTAMGKIDGMIVGSITRFSTNPRTMSIDVRLINANSLAVMHASRKEVRYSGTLDVSVDEDDIAALAEEIRSALPNKDSILDAAVVSVNDEEIVINCGDEKKIRKGMAALVYASGDSIVDPTSGERLSDRAIIAEVFVIAVEPKLSRAQVSRPSKRKARAQEEWARAADRGELPSADDLREAIEEERRQGHSLVIKPGDLIRFK